MQVILSALCPLLSNSTWPQHTLQMFPDHCGPRQTIPWEAIHQELLQPQGELYPIQTTFNHRSRDQLLEFRTSFYETISSEFLVQRNFKHTQFSWEHWLVCRSHIRPYCCGYCKLEYLWGYYEGACSDATMKECNSCRVPSLVLLTCFSQSSHSRTSLPT